jgi:rare lipoprotein A
MPHRTIAALVLACLIALPADAAAPCTASWYGGGEYLNRHTASGERFDPTKLTAASRTLPFGTRVRVTYRGRSIVVRISDRGPAKWTGRCIDLSRGAAKAIGLTRAGVGEVTITVIGK